MITPIRAMSVTARRVVLVLLCAASFMLAPADQATAGTGGGARGASAEQSDDRPLELSIRPPRIEDPQGWLDRFYERLAAAERRERGVLARITVYADSVNGWDGVTSTLRHALQARFGDGGKGWVHLAKGWTYQHHRDVSWTHSEDWRTHVLNRGLAPGNRYGLGGVMAADGSRQSKATFATTTDHAGGGAVSRYRVFYQAFPEAGSIRLSVDGGEAVEVQTAAAAVDDRVQELRVPDGPHSLEVSVGQRNVRLYGVVMEREGPGVVVDSIALIGARVARLNIFDQAHWRKQIALREPDLLVFWLGGNNATARAWSRADFEQDYGRAIATARQGRPEASCLVASVTDVGLRETGETIAHVPDLVEAQRAVALAQRCGFLDLYSAMGGQGSMARWTKGSPRLGTPDFRHLTPEGAERVGGYFTEALIKGYEAFRGR